MDVQTLNVADSQRTKVVSMQIIDTQGGLPANGPRKRYEPAILPTGAGWHGESGVGLEILRVKFTLEWLSDSYTAASPSDVNQSDTNVGATVTTTAATLPVNGGLSSVTHTLRLHRLWNWQSTDNKQEMEDLKPFAVARREFFIGWEQTSVPAAGSRHISAMTVTQTGFEWDLTDGMGHGLIITNPYLQLTGESVCANTHTTTAMLALTNAQTMKATAHIICRAVNVDLDTFYKCC